MDRDQEVEEPLRNRARILKTASTARRAGLGLTIAAMCAYVASNNAWSDCTSSAVSRTAGSSHVRLAILERVQPDREGEEEPAVDRADLGLELEHVAIAELAEHALVVADRLPVVTEDEVERQPLEEREDVRAECPRTAARAR